MHSNGWIGHVPQLSEVPWSESVEAHMDADRPPGAAGRTMAPSGIPVRPGTSGSLLSGKGREEACLVGTRLAHVLAYLGQGAIPMTSPASSPRSRYGDAVIGTSPLIQSRPFHRGTGVFARTDATVVRARAGADRIPSRTRSGPTAPCFTDRSIDRLSRWGR